MHFAIYFPFIFSEKDYLLYAIFNAYPWALCKIQESKQPKWTGIELSGIFGKVSKWIPNLYTSSHSFLSSFSFFLFYQLHLMESDFHTCCYIWLNVNQMEDSIEKGQGGSYFSKRKYKFRILKYLF